MGNLDLLLARNAQLIALFEEGGDDVSVPRSVDHVVTVPRRRAAAVVTDLEALGFRVYDRSGLLRTTLEFDRDDAVDAAAAEAFVRQIHAVADRHGGVYDGWGAMSLAVGDPAYEPEDALDPADVPVAAELTRLRAEYADRLIADGCPSDLAARRAGRLDLAVGADVWGLSDDGGTSSYTGRYSPSRASAEAAELADSAIADNRGRRRPAWVSQG